jgi:hypothetical protein
MEITNTFTAADRASWRKWLEEHGVNESEVWLVYYKATTGKPCISYQDSLEEALCFGWVDSIIQKIDEEKYARKFTPRRAGSKWSELNKHLVARLVKEGRMTEAGMAKVDFALDEAPKSAVPAGLVEGCADDPSRRVGELPEAGAVATEELHRLDLGGEKRRDAAEEDPLCDRTVGEGRAPGVDVTVVTRSIVTID